MAKPAGITTLMRGHSLLHSTEVEDFEIRLIVLCVTSSVFSANQRKQEATVGTGQQCRLLLDHAVSDIARTLPNPMTLGGES